MVMLPKQSSVSLKLVCMGVFVSVIALFATTIPQVILGSKGIEAEGSRGFYFASDAYKYILWAAEATLQA